MQTEAQTLVVSQPKLIFFDKLRYFTEDSDSGNLTPVVQERINLGCGYDSISDKANTPKVRSVLYGPIPLYSSNTTIPSDLIYIHHGRNCLIFQYDRRAEIWGYHFNVVDPFSEWCPGVDYSCEDDICIPGETTTFTALGTITLDEGEVVMNALYFMGYLAYITAKPSITEGAWDYKLVDDGNVAAYWTMPGKPLIVRWKEWSQYIYSATNRDSSHTITVVTDSNYWYGYTKDSEPNGIYFPTKYDGIGWGGRSGAFFYHTNRNMWRILTLETAVSIYGAMMLSYRENTKYTVDYGGYSYEEFVDPATFVDGNGVFYLTTDGTLKCKPFDYEIPHDSVRFGFAGVPHAITKVGDQEYLWVYFMEYHKGFRYMAEIYW